MTHMLLMHGADAPEEIDRPDKRGMTPLACAVGYGHVESAAHLLAKGANIDGALFIDNQEYTLLELAADACENKEEMVALLERYAQKAKKVSNRWRKMPRAATS